MIYYTVNHFVTRDDTADGPLTASTVHGDDRVAVWLTSQHQTDPPDLWIEQPPEGFTWKTDLDGFTMHPPELAPEDHLERLTSLLSDTELARIKEDYQNEKIVRVSPWETPLTDGYSQG